MQIHPTIAMNSVGRPIPREVPICCKLELEEGIYQPSPDKNGTLEDLHHWIGKLIEKEKKNTLNQICFELEYDYKQYFKTLEELQEDLEFLNHYQKVVICCPIHYLESNEKIQEERELTKLLYIVRQSQYQELDDFYFDNMDREVQRKKNIHFYKDIQSIAKIWSQEIVELYQKSLPRQTEDKLKERGTF